MSANLFGGLTLPVGHGTPIVRRAAPSAPAPAVAAPVVVTAVAHASQATPSAQPQVNLTALPPGALPTEASDASANLRTLTGSARTEKRRAQNRESQRASRQRRKRESAEMEQAQDDLRAENKRLKEENQALLEILSRVRDGHLSPSAIALTEARDLSARPLPTVNGRIPSVLARSSRPLAPASALVLSGAMVESPGVIAQSPFRRSTSMEGQSSDGSRNSTETDPSSWSGEISSASTSDFIFSTSWTNSPEVEVPHAVGQAVPTSQQFEQVPLLLAGGDLEGQMVNWGIRQEGVSGDHAMASSTAEDEVERLAMEGAVRALSSLP